MDEQLKNSYSEVNQILNILGNTYKEKIPKKLLNSFKKNQNSNFHPKIDKNYKFSRNTLIIISILNYKYWEKDEQKLHKYKNIYANNEVEYQNEINKFKELDWLNNQKESNEKSTEKRLIINDNPSFLRKIINSIKRILKK